MWSNESRALNNISIQKYDHRSFVVESRKIYDDSSLASVEIQSKQIPVSSPDAFSVFSEYFFKILTLENSNSRWKLNNTRKARAETDGLTDLRYRLLNTVKHPMYTKLIIDIRRVEVTNLVLYIDGKPSMEIDLYPGRFESVMNSPLHFPKLSPLSSYYVIALSTFQ